MTLRSRGTSSRYRPVRPGLSGEQFDDEDRGFDRVLEGFEEEQ
jgi:hypothetical protein